MASLKRKIGLEDIRFKAAIGFYEEERILKNEFVVNLWAEMEVCESESNTDELSNTVDYVKLYAICKAAFDKERKLIEPVGHEILSSIIKEFAFIKAVYIKIQKLNPPIQAEIARSFVELNYTVD